MAAFYREAYQVASLEDSARRIVEAVLSAGPTAAPTPTALEAAAGPSTAGPVPAASTAKPMGAHGLMRVLVAHNGPTGLGARRQDICGVDWMAGQEGDHGDPDLEVGGWALGLFWFRQAREMGRVPCWVAGEGGAPPDVNGC